MKADIRAPFRVRAAAWGMLLVLLTVFFSWPAVAMETPDTEPEAYPLQTDRADGEEQPSGEPVFDAEGTPAALDREGARGEPADGEAALPRDGSGPYLPPLLAGVLAPLVTALLKRWKGKKGKKEKLLAGLCLLVAACRLLTLRDPQPDGGPPLVPFGSCGQMLSDPEAALRGLESILLFVPPGFAAGLCERHGGRKVLLLQGFGAGLWILRYLTGLGRMDADGVLGIILGSLAGFAAARLSLGNGGREESLLIRAVRGLVRVLYRPRIVYLDPSVRSRLAEGGCVAVCNHMAVSDGPVVFEALEGRYRALVAKDWYEKPLLRPFLKAAECIPLDRQHPGLAWLRSARSALREGKNILVFPEGKVRKDGEIGEFKPGTALLCILTGAPAVPVSIAESYTVLRPARIVVGELMEADRDGAKDEALQKAFCERLRAAVERNRRAADSGAKKTGEG